MHHTDAAADAFAGYMLFQTMDAKRKALDPVPPLPEFDELDRPIRIKAKESRSEAKTKAKDDDDADSVDAAPEEPVKRVRRRAKSAEPAATNEEPVNKVVRRRAKSVDSADFVEVEPVQKVVKKRGRPRKTQ